MNADHELDEAEVTEMTQMISALEQNGFTHDLATKVYQEINKTFGLKRKEMPYEELDEETKYNEILRVIGFNDGKNSEIAFDSLNEVIRNCIPYREGYELGKHLREDIDYQNMTSKGMRR